jgi:hypothetical protein
MAFYQFHRQFHYVLGERKSGGVRTAGIRSSYGLAESAPVDYIFIVVMVIVQQFVPLRRLAKQ